jgi:hypothetical protein
MGGAPDRYDNGVGWRAHADGALKRNR